MPKIAFLSGMPSPDLQFEKRPWNQQQLLNDAQFKEECRMWDINEIVFSDGMWRSLEPLLRSDFSIFDTYHWTHAEELPFSFPIHTFWGELDRRVTEDMVQGWQGFTTGQFVCAPIHGNHLWPLDKASKHTWLHRIVQALQNMTNV